MASNPWAAAARATPNELREIPIFAELTDGDLRLLAARSREQRLETGEILFAEGEPADAFHVVLDGELRITKTIEGRETEIDLLPSGGFTGDIGLLIDLPHVGTARALRPTKLLVLDRAAFRALITELPAVAREVLPLMGARVQGAEVLVREREKLAALGKLSAGLAHELNNPAAAVRRAADQLSAALAGQEANALRLGALALSPDQIAALQAARGAVGRSSTPLDPVARSDREDELAFYLEDRGVADAWEMAPGLVEAGLDLAAVEAVAAALPAEAVADGIGWVAGGLTVSGLVEEVRRGAERISALVQAVKNYSFMDRGPLQEIDVREGLESTLTILRHKLGNVEIGRDYAPDLPRILGHGSELNQVWTNLIDNAIDAMGGHGRISLRTSRTSDGIEVEIADNGPGVPLEVQERIFHPFFTTKRMGSGTGLGLDIVYRIVVNRHGGTIRLASEPGDTRFVVRLPSTPPIDAGEHEGG
jgi:signal transduction histidine kinase